jgi:hypothetical protein
MPLYMKVDKAGMKRAKRMMNRMEKDAPDAFLRAVYDEAVEIFKDSQERVPVDTGDLRASGRLEPPTRANPSCEITYDTIPKNQRDYAGIVHEGYEMNFQHGKEAGYLINAINHAVDGPMEHRIEQATAENIVKKRGIRGLKGRKGSKGPLAKKKE